MADQGQVDDLLASLGVLRGECAQGLHAMQSAVWDLSDLTSSGSIGVSFMSYAPFLLLPI